MVILSAQNIEKSFGVSLLFRDITFDVQHDDKIALIGINGSGKTTLFKLLIGKEEADKGGFAKSSGVKIGYMEQHVIRDSETSVYDEALTVFRGLAEIEAELGDIHDKIDFLGDKVDEKLLNEQMMLQDRFQREGGLTYQSRTRSALLGLGYTEDELKKPVSVLSGGEKSKLQLAKLLLTEVNLLLLDEPTNHLDLQAMEWLEKFLTEYKGAYIVISHDRYFLDRVANKVVEIENHHMTLYQGNYTEFMRKKEEARKAAAKKYEETLKEIHRIEKIIEQQKRFNQAHNYVTIASKQKSIDRLQETLEKPEESPLGMRFNFKCKDSTGNDVLTVEGLSLSFGERTLFHDASMEIKKSERVFLLGANGCGKTSLFKCLTGEYQCTGSVEYGSRVEWGYYDQTQSGLDNSKTAFSEIHDSFPTMTHTEVRSALGQFLFKGDDVFKEIEKLSGGEKARVALLKLMLSGANLLLLDEPTNHLDMLSREALENALLSYGGTLLVISHDRYLINKMATRVYELTESGLTGYIGNYEYYLQKKQGLDKEAFEAIKEAAKPQNKGDSYRQKRERESEIRKTGGKLDRILKTISDIEQSIEDIMAELGKPEVATDYQRTLELGEQHQTQEDALEAALEEWENLSNLLESLEKQDDNV